MSSNNGVSRPNLEGFIKLMAEIIRIVEGSATHILIEELLRGEIGVVVFDERISGINNGSHMSPKFISILEDSLELARRKYADGELHIPGFVKRPNSASSNTTPGSKRQAMQPDSSAPPPNVFVKPEPSDPGYNSATASQSELTTSVYECTCGKKFMMYGPFVIHVEKCQGLQLPMDDVAAKIIPSLMHSIPIRASAIMEELRRRQQPMPNLDSSHMSGMPKHPMGSESSFMAGYNNKVPYQPSASNMPPRGVPSGLMDAAQFQAAMLDGLKCLTEEIHRLRRRVELMEGNVAERLLNLEAKR